MRGISLGCQTNAWPVDPARFDTLLTVMGKIRELGFAGFETGFRNLESQAENIEAARQKIASSGLQFFGVHIFLSQYDEATHIAPAELYEKVCQTGGALGAQRLILSGAPVSSGDELARKVAGLHQAAVSAKKRGMKLAYHNHNKEFSNSAWEFQGLLRLTDPSEVGFCWTQATRSKAAPMFQHFSRRTIGGSPVCTCATFVMAGKSRSVPATFPWHRWP